MLWIKVTVFLALSAAAYAPLLGQAAKDSSNKSAKTSLADPAVQQPSDVYRAVLFPLESVRGAIENWSPIEQNALAAAIKGASKACVEIDLESIKGGELLSLGQLCSFGINWQKAVQASRLYLSSSGPQASGLAMAYAIEIDSLLHLKDEAAAFQDAEAMIANLPYDDRVASTSDEAIEYMQFLFTKDAIQVAARRQSLILQALKKGKALDSHSWNGATGTTLQIPSLYKQGLKLVELEFLIGDPIKAQTEDGALEAAIVPDIDASNRITIDRVRRLHQMTGKNLTEYGLEHLITPSENVKGGITVFLIYPLWCSQCKNIAESVPKDGFSVSGYSARAFAVPYISEKVRSDIQASGAVLGDKVTEKRAAEVFGGLTPQGQQALLDLEVTEVPALVIADEGGVIRFVATADASAFHDGDVVDSAVATIGSRFH